MRAYHFTRTRESIATVNVVILTVPHFSYAAHRRSKRTKSPMTRSLPRTGAPQCWYVLLMTMWIVKLGWLCDGGADTISFELRACTQDQSKREILKTRILPTMATNRTLQRVVTKYQLMLSEITSREADSEEDENESDSVDDSEA